MKNNMWRIAAILGMLLIILSLSIKIPAVPETKDYAERVIYTQESISDISGRTYSDPSVLPAHQTIMATFGLGSSATSQGITWNVGDFTGVYVPDPKDRYQRGINNSWYGSTAVQMYGTMAGVQVHTYSAPSHPSSNLANGQMAYQWLDSDNVRIWRDSSSIMKISLYIQVPTVWVEGGAVAYSNIILLLKDTTSGQKIWFIMNIYDTRGSSSFYEWVGWDSVTNIAMAATYFGSGTTYGYRSSQSAVSTGEIWSGWRYYEFLVNTNNFTNAINAVNQQYSLGLSTNPLDYIITLLTVQAEIYWPEGGNGHIGVGMKDLRLSEIYWSVDEFSFHPKNPYT